LYKNGFNNGGPSFDLFFQIEIVIGIGIEIEFGARRVYRFIRFSIQMVINTKPISKVDFGQQ